MESYVEVSWLNSALLLYVSVLLGSFASLQPLRELPILMYAAVLSLLGVVLWETNSMLWIVLSEVLFFLSIFRYAQKTFVFAFCFRYLWMMTCFVCYGGSFHNGFWFVPLHAHILWSWLILIVIWLYTKSRWRIRLCDKNCLYPVTLYIQDATLHVLGYLDSGNRLSQRGIPVIFLHRRYVSYFDKVGIQLVVMKTIRHQETLDCYPCELRLEGGKRQAVLVHLESLELPLHSELLLNMKVMTMG